MFWAVARFAGRSLTGNLVEHDRNIVTGRRARAEDGFRGSVQADVVTTRNPRLLNVLLIDKHDCFAESRNHLSFLLNTATSFLDVGIASDKMQKLVIALSFI